MMVIHFPSALFVMDLIFSAMAFFGYGSELSNAAYYCLMAGAIGGWFAILTGTFDLFTYLSQNADNVVPRPAIIHASIQIVMVLGFTFVLAAEYNRPELIRDPATWMWVTKFMLVTAMTVGNYYGGELVLKYIAKKF
jgi:uncharacterized membrane protein